VFKIRKGDLVQVIKGKDAGKRGKVLKVYPGQGRVIVEGVNFLKKHKRRTQQDQQGGIVSIEAPLAISNLMLVCKSCSKPVRVGFMVQQDGSKVRFCKSCKEVI